MEQMGSFSSFGNHAVPCSCGHETDEMSPSFPSSAVQFGTIPTRPSCFSFHHSIPGCKVWDVFFTSICPNVQEWGTGVQVGGAKTVEASGHLPASILPGFARRGPTLVAAYSG